MKRCLSGFVILALLLVVIPAWAAPPSREIPFAKKVRLAYPQRYTFRFSLWDSSDPNDPIGTMVWSEEKDIRLTSRTLRHLLGSVDPAGNPLQPEDFSQQLWVQVDRWSSRTSLWIALGGRTRLNATPYSLHSESVRAESIVTESLQNGAVTDAKISGPISAAKIEHDGLDADTIDGSHAGDLAPLNHNHDDTYVNEGQTDSVTSGMIADGEVGAADMEDGAALAEISDNDGSGSGLDADKLDGVEAAAFPRIRLDTTLPGGAGNSVTIAIPHYRPFTLQLSSGWPAVYGLAEVMGFENDWDVGITYVKYNGDGTSASGGAECSEGTNAVILTFGVAGPGSVTYTVSCPNELNEPHNLVLTVNGGIELYYRLIY